MTFYNFFINAKNSLTKGDAIWDFPHTYMELLSQCKLYVIYLTVEAKLYGAYLTYDTVKIYQIYLKA